jgi:cytochrome c-type biogenesis protein CcmH
MILFWLICTGMVAIALAFVLPPLLQGVSKDDDAEDQREANIDIYRDQLSELEADLANGIVSPEQYQQDRDEIERRLLDDVSTANEPAKKKAKQAVADRRPAYAIALGIPAVAVVLYLIVGNSAALSGAATTPVQAPFAAGSQSDGGMPQQAIEANVAKLAKRLEQNPADADGWVMLARSYMSLEKYSEASTAYAKAAALKTNDADLLADYAFALAMVNGRQLQGQPLELVKKALQVNPQNAKALELAGSGEFQAKNYVQAIAYWQKVLALTPADSELARTLADQIKEAKSLADTNAR